MWTQNHSCVELCKEWKFYFRRICRFQNLALFWIEMKTEHFLIIWKWKFQKHVYLGSVKTFWFDFYFLFCIVLQYIIKKEKMESKSCCKTKNQMKMGCFHTVWSLFFPFFSFFPFILWGEGDLPKWILEKSTWFPNMFWFWRNCIIRPNIVALKFLDPLYSKALVKFRLFPKFIMSRAKLSQNSGSKHPKLW